MADFRKAFTGDGKLKSADDIDPDGRTPKVNEPEPKGKDGTYTLRVLKSNGVEVKQPVGLSFKVEFEVIECDNGRFKPGTVVCFLQHGIIDPLDWAREYAIGNCKEIVAAMYTSKYGVEVNSADPNCDGDSWVDVLTLACAKEGSENETAFAGAVIKTQVNTAMSQGRRGGTPRAFARLKHTALPSQEKAA